MVLYIEPGGSPDYINICPHGVLDLNIHTQGCVHLRQPWSRNRDESNLGQKWPFDRFLDDFSVTKLNAHIMSCKKCHGFLVPLWDIYRGALWPTFTQISEFFSESGN